MVNFGKKITLQLLMQPVGEQTIFFVWDSRGTPPVGNWLHVDWRGGDNELSIPSWVEKQSESLRTRFLAWLYELGEAKVGGCRVVDHLEIRPGFSYWWMTLLAEKSYAKSDRLYDAVRLLALEELVTEKSVKAIILATHDRTLARVFRLWCARAGLTFECRWLGRNMEVYSFSRRFFNGLPLPIQAVAYLLRHVWKRWSLCQEGAVSDTAFFGKITFVDYLFHLAPNAISSGHYRSNYWTDLGDVLKKYGVRVNCLHHYVGHQAIPTARRAREVIAAFNRSAAGQECHIALDGVFGWSVITGAVRDYFRILLKGICLRGARRYFVFQQSNLDLWPLFKDDWGASMFGATAMENCLFLNLFEHMLSRLPRQNLGIYLQENQGWERAFVYAWKAASHGRLVGVPHTCINFWDMRFFADINIYKSNGRNDCPNPDVVALNGPVAKAAFMSGGYPADRVTDVEALRYLYLEDFCILQDSLRSPSPRVIRVLILCDYITSVTRQQMQWLSDAAQSLPLHYHFWVKPHPASPIKANDYPSLRLQIVEGSLGNLLSDFDVAYTSNTTSAAVDAYSVGLPVVSMFDGETFNMSPLKGLDGVTYVAGPRELAQALLGAARYREVKKADFFNLDKRLLRWRRLLGLDEN